MKALTNFQCIVAAHDRQLSARLAVVPAAAHPGCLVQPGRRQARLEIAPLLDHFVDREVVDGRWVSDFYW